MNQKSNQWKKLKGGPAKLKSQRSRGEMEGCHIRVSRVNDKVVGQAHLQDTPEQNRVPVRPKAIDKHRNQIQQLASIVVYI